tara:strand:+ start:435 stop:602 length:168 start_codon:yes stop_codon:yes gene_type:complete
MKGVKHYTKDGKVWNGKTHKHPDGTVMTGAKMTSNSKKLVHYKDLSAKAKKGIQK